MKNSLGRVAIVGAGAVGCYYGARLAESGQDVTFLLRSEYTRIKANGLTVKSVDGDVFLPDPQIAQKTEDIGEVDWVIIALKTTANGNFPKLLKPLLSPRTRIVTLQNGLGSVEALRDQFPDHEIYGGLCFVCINRLEDGVISHTAGGAVTIGASDFGQDSMAQELAEAFQTAKVEARATKNLLRAQWMKLLWNVPFNGIAIADGGVDTEKILSTSEGEARVRRVMIEVISAAQFLGHEIPSDQINKQIERTRGMGKYRPSSMIDYLEKRPVEIESIWQEPLRQAEAAGFAGPEWTRLLKQIEASLAARVV